MAARYARAGGGNWTADATWSTTSGGSADTVAPTAADDVFLDGSSGNVTINAAAACRSINCTGFTGTLTHNAFTLTIGDGTAGASNIALKFVSGMTYTASGGISFISTSVTQQTVDFAGKTTAGTIDFNATSNGSWQYTGTHNTFTSGTVTLTKGTLDTNGQTCSWGRFNSSNNNTRTLTITNSNITITTSTATTWNFDGNNATFNSSGAYLTISGADTGIAPCPNTISWHSSSTIEFTGGGDHNMFVNTGNVGNLTFTGPASKTTRYLFNANYVVSGTLTINGNSTINRLYIQSNLVSTPRTITAATVSCSNVDFNDITGAGAASWDLSAITGGSGDCGGNSGIIFTTPATQTWSGTSGGNWSANAWTSRVPLPQDDVVISSAFSASQTITADMPRLGKSIDWTGSTGSPTFAFSSVENSLYGSLTLISGMTISGTKKTTFSGRSSFTITSAGKTLTQAINFTAPGGTYTLNDALSCSDNISLNNGTFNTNSYNVTYTGEFNTNNSNTRSLLFGTSILTSTGTSSGLNVLNITTATGMTCSASNSTFIIQSSTSNSRNFRGANFTFGTLQYTVAGSTGSLVITGSNSFAAINFSDVTNARTLQFAEGTTTTIRSASGWQVYGTTGKLMTVQSATAATHTISCASGTISSDYLNISYSIATGGATFYAGANSTNGGNNSGWLFEAAPPTGSSRIISHYLDNIKLT